MKKSIILCIPVMLLFACAGVKSQTASLETEKIEKTTKRGDITFESLLGATLTDINTNKTPKDIFKNINKLKRISAKYPQEWLSDYYVALLNIKISMAMDDQEKIGKLLKEANEKIETIKLKENVIESEVLTLKGYYYYAKIAADPQTNGQLYYKDVIGSYQKARNIDKNNPRPALMLAVFQNRMAQFRGGSTDDFCAQLQGITQLFKNFTPASKVHPKWGNQELIVAQKKYCQQ